MRILYLVSYYKPAVVYGGSVTSVANLCEALVRNGNQVTVLTTNANGEKTLDVPINQLVKNQGVDVYYYPITPFIPKNLFFSTQFIQTLGKTIDQFDIVIADLLWTPAMHPVITNSNRLNKPCIIPLHGQLLPWSLNFRKYKKKIYLNLVEKYNLNKATAIHCTTIMEESALSRLNLRTPAFVIPNGLDLGKYSLIQEKGYLHKKLDLIETSILLLFLGRLHRVKRPDIALEAFANVNRPDLHLIYVGPDEENVISKLQKRARELNCIERVHFLGLQEAHEVLKILFDTDLLIMPSEMESFGMAALEALAAGVPILTSNNVPIGNWAEMAGAGQTTSCNSNAFAYAINDLLQSTSQLKLMGEKGKRLVKEQFDTTIIVEKLLSTFRTIIASGKPN